MKRIKQGLIISTAILVFSSFALANEFTDVIDAFDQEINDPFDISLLVGYERFQRKGLIRREAFDLTPEDWDYYAYRNMFKYKEVRHILNLGLDIGIFRDMSLRLGLPLILSDQHNLTAHEDQEWTDVNDKGKPLSDNIMPDSFRSPDRSGVDYLSAAFWWGILDQGRDDTKPNWTFFLEGRFGIGDVLKASTKDNLEGGVSRGLNELYAGTRLSRRYGIFDPFFGFDVLVGFPKSGTGYIIEGHRRAQLNQLPPIVGHMDFGMELVPWEIPAKNLKLSVILGATAIYHSEGRDYSPMFDILGTSDYFKENGVDFDGDGKIENNEMSAAEAAATWTGMTDIENYGTFQGTLALVMQPAKYIKFKIGTVLGHDTEHFITKTDQCRSNNMGSDGLCSDLNFGYRPELDEPGKRFRAEKTFVFDFFIDAAAMF